MTAVIERNAIFDTDFATEPYEVAWAREARWFFLPTEPKTTTARMAVMTEVSPDGLHWCPLDVDEIHLGSVAMTTWASREFGGWLRLRGTVLEPGPVRGSIYLVLKA